MSKPRVEIIQFPRETVVRVDGEKVPGLRSVTYSEEVGKPKTVTLTLYASHVEARSAAEAHGERP